MDRATILLVEDDVNTRYVLAERLHGCFQEDRILVAESGEAGLELARRTSPDVVVLDLHLRGMGGFAFAEAIRGAAKAPAIVALTGDTRAETRRLAKAAGFGGFLVKPEGVDRIADVVRQLLGRLRPPDDP